MFCLILCSFNRFVFFLNPSHTPCSAQPHWKKCASRLLSTVINCINLPSCTYLLDIGVDKIVLSASSFYLRLLFRIHLAFEMSRVLTVQTGLLKMDSADPLQVIKETHRDNSSTEYDQCPTTQCAPHNHVFGTLNCTKHNL